MSENIIFVQIKLGACVIPLSRVILSGKIYYSLILYKYHRKRPPISEINWIIQGHFKVKRSILGSSE